MFASGALVILSVFNRSILVANARPPCPAIKLALKFPSACQQAIGSRADLATDAPVP